MISVKKIVTGMLGENCYLCTEGRGKAVLIDPGDHPAELLDQVRKSGCHLEAILLTHGHFDHVGAVALLREFTGASVMIAEGDVRCLTEPMAALGQVELCSPDRVLQDGDEIFVGEMAFTCFLTPGHSPGSCVYLCDGILFSGDTLFAGSCGRWDLPGGDISALRKSLLRLRDLHGNWRVLPGHGEETDLDTERQWNSMLKETGPDRW